MDPQISTALTLLAIGMLTVFTVLALVVFTGNILIAVTNRLEVTLPKPNEPGDNPNHIVAISAAVEVITQGKGSVSKISKQ